MAAYYTNLNKMRQRFGLGTISVPSIPAGTKAQAAHINNLNTAMNNAYTAARNKKYNNVASFTSFAVTAGSLILASTDTNIDAILAGWNAACVNQSVNGTNGTNDTFSDFGDNDTFSTNSTNSTNGTCSEGGYTYGDTCSECPDCST